MTGTLGRPEGGIEDRALGSRREGGRDFFGRALEYRERGATAGRFLFGDLPSASCGFGMTWLTSNEETLVEEVFWSYHQGDISSDEDWNCLWGHSEGGHRVGRVEDSKRRLGFSDGRSRAGHCECLSKWDL